MIRAPCTYQPHIRSPFQRLHNNPACGGLGSGGRDQSRWLRFKPGRNSVVHLVPARLIRPVPNCYAL